MTVMTDNDSVRAVTLGVRVARATAVLPQTGDGTLFTVAGGRIELVTLLGEVKTVIQTQANATKIKFNPTASGADQDLCATLNITADPVGEYYTISGAVGDALRSDLLIGNGQLNTPLVLAPGDIELDCAASNTGSVSWTIIYIALDTGVTVVAA